MIALPKMTNEERLKLSAAFEKAGMGRPVWTGQDDGSLLPVFPKPVDEARVLAVVSGVFPHSRPKKPTPAQPKKKPTGKGAKK